MAGQQPETIEMEAVDVRRMSSSLIRVVFEGPGLADFTSTGILDEWVALTVPGQFQTRYYSADIHRGALATPPFVAEALGEL